MKVLPAVLRALSLLILTAALPVQAADSAFPDIQRILDAGTLRVAILGRDAPPMIMTAADGSPAGSEADLARDLAAKLGVEITFVRTAQTYDQVVDQVADKTADLGVSFLSRGVDRALHVLFSQPYIRQSGRVFYKRTAFARLKRDYGIDTLSAIESTDAVDAIQFGVVAGSVYQDILERSFPNVHIKPYTALPELMQAVRNGEIFGGVNGGLQISYYMRQHPSTAIHVAVDPTVHRPSDICIAVRPDAPSLLRWVDIYLANNVGIEDAEDLVKRYVEQQEAEAEKAEKAEMTDKAADAPAQAEPG